MAGSASATTRPKERCGASHWEGATGPSPAPNAAPTAPPSCSPSSPPHASTTSTQKPGSPTSSLASPIFPPRVCTNCCPGNGSACAKPICPPISRPPEPLAPHHKPASARAPATIPRPCPCEYPTPEEDARRGHPLCALALGGPDALHRRWPHRTRQQCRRALDPPDRAQPEKYVVRGLRRWCRAL